MTFKQLEALYWTAKLGGFLPAAQKLHTTQSAISKRVQELESLLGTPLFDRTLRSARLTEKGSELLVHATRLLDMRAEVLDRMSQHDVIERTLRLGVTELTSMTWLPTLVEAIQARYPKVIVEPHVDMSANLRDRLLAEEIDLMIVPEIYAEPRFASQYVGKVENAWMSRPGLVTSERPLSLVDLGAYRVLLDKSGPGMVYDRWFKSKGFTPASTLTSNSIVALAAMTISGLGISYFPRHCLQPLLSANLLQILEVNPGLPDVPYAAMYKAESPSELTCAVISLAQECCDFSTLIKPEAPLNRPLPGVVNATN
ncbi:LysR family transcriptional regulator [Pseudomonas sp. CR3202]|uniref:LysR family transcriptional regulator n=1 Tax=Pseudomonas sp. CR3202 TaxID=3351532 RepID=UPI003BF15AE7